MEDEDDSNLENRVNFKPKSILELIKEYRNFSEYWVDRLVGYPVDGYR